ncbi:MAG TPA: phage tail protein [Acidimicrobiales bacterium]|nr:phage tail protein [Acidimicrobiales bacterium]
MRGSIEGLLSPKPMTTLLPALYQDDDVALAFVDGLDEVLAPVLVTCDSVEAYVDPHLAPLDFVEWLAGWVGIELDETWPDERKRNLVARAADLFAWQGTVRGMADLVEVYVGVRPEIEDSGGVTWSPSPQGDLPGTPAMEMTVRVRVDDPASVDARRLERLVARAKPAEVVHRVEVVGR